MKLADILKDSNYKLSQFTMAEIEQLEQTITLKATKNGEVPYTVCLVRQKAIKLTPEESIRQLYLRVLSDRLHYPLSRIQVEYGVNFGREVKRADIVVMDKDRDIQKYNARGLQPIYSENGSLSVINSRHILEQHLDYENFERTEIEYWSSQEKARVYRNDILIYTTGANIGRTNVYLSNERALASNHVNILRLKEEDQIYVGFVINSLMGRLQTEKLSAGSAQAELYPKDIDNFVIPFIAKEKQEQVVNQYVLSFKRKQKSKQLLEIAKTGVERAIETDEAIATTWINQQLKALNIEIEVLK